MNSRYRCAILALAILCPLARSFSQDPCGDAKRALRKTTDNDQYGWFTINNLFNWYGNNGSSSYNHTTANSGFEYPKGSSKTAIFEDGVVWGGFHKGSATPKVNGSTYRPGLQAGAVTGYGGAGEDERPTADDPTLPKYRVYRVRPDITPATSFSTVQPSMEAEAALISRYNAITAQQLFDRYVKDWNEWPAKDGLPAAYADVNKDGKYDPSVDIPGQPGADQTLYYVANDLDAARAANFASSPPIGLEMHRTVWGYNVPGALGNAIFSSTLLINKSGAAVDSMFVTQWSDPDLGEAGDDLGGCDVERNLGFVYNGQNSDAIYGIEVPAIGYRLVEGPMIRTGNSGDSAIFRMNRRRGYRNLPMTAVGVGICGSAIYLCTPSPGLEGAATEWYRIMNGRMAVSDGEYIDPTTGLPTRYVFNGDPVTGLGWLNDMNGLRPGDRNITLSSGPFRLANADSQEIVVATLIGAGADRISSVSVLRHNSDILQTLFDGLMVVPKPPPAPEVVVGALDGEITLSWSDTVGAVSIEKWKSGGHAFEGYNVYQYDGPTGDAKRRLRLATYDIPNTATYIFDDVFDEDSKLYMPGVVQFGSNSGIRRFYRTIRDSLLRRPLANGTPYYFGVSAYTFCNKAGAKPSQLESEPKIMTIVPQWPQGVRYVSDAGDTLTGLRHEGPSSGRVNAVVLNPSAVPREGATYKVVFTGFGQSQVWHLIRTVGAKTDTVARNQPGQTGEDSYAVIVDGIDWRVYSAPLDFRYFLTVSNKNGAISPYQQGALALQASGFPLSPDGVDRPDGTKQQTAGLTAAQGWVIHTGMNSLTMGFGFEYFKSRVTQSGARWSQIVPYDWEIRFTATGGKALCPAALTGKTDRVIDVPFELWNIGINTPDNTADDYRLPPYLMDIDGNYQFNLLTKNGTDSVDLGGGGPDHSISGGDNDPFTDWIYWVQPLDKSPGQAGYNAAVADAQAKIAANQDPYLSTASVSGDVMRRMVIVGWNVGSVSANNGNGVFSLPMPETGTVFRIITSKPNTPADIFTITLPPADQSAEIASADAERVNVFPNPFVGTRDPKSGTIERFVTFTHLPARATIRIYTLSGTLVRSFAKEDVSPFFKWDLTSDYGKVVAPGIYIVRIEMSDAGVTKILKLGVLAAE